MSYIDTLGTIGGQIRDMKKTKVTSKNQKGGITAKNVNFNNGSNQFNINDETDKKEQRPLTKMILIIVGIVGFIASIVTVLAYFDIYPFNK